MKTIFSLSRKTPLPRLALSTPYIPKRHYIYSAYSKGMLPTDHPVKGSNNHSPCTAQFEGYDEDTKDVFLLKETQTPLEYNYTHIKPGQKILGKSVIPVGLDYKKRLVGVVLPGSSPQNNPTTSPINPPSTEKKFDEIVNYNHDLGLFSKIIKSAQQAINNNNKLQITKLTFQQSFDRDDQPSRLPISVAITNQEILNADSDVNVKSLFDLKNIYIK